MEARDRLAFYKRKQLEGQALTAEEQSDMAAIIRDRGEASSPPMPGGGQKEADAEQVVEEEINTQG